MVRPVAQSRLQLFDRVRALTSARDADGRFVLAKGPVDLHALTRSPQSTDSTRTAALAIVLGGVHGAEIRKVRCNARQLRVDHEVQQACKMYVGDITRQRRQWCETQRRRLQRRAFDAFDSWRQQARVGTAPVARRRSSGGRGGKLRGKRHSQGGGAGTQQRRVRSAQQRQLARVASRGGPQSQQQQQRKVVMAASRLSRATCPSPGHRTEQGVSAT